MAKRPPPECYMERIGRHIGLEPKHLDACHPFIIEPGAAAVAFAAVNDQGQEYKSQYPFLYWLPFNQVYIQRENIPAITEGLEVRNGAWLFAELVSGKRGEPEMTIAVAGGLWVHWPDSEPVVWNLCSVEITARSTGVWNTVTQYAREDLQELYNGAHTNQDIRDRMIDEVVAFCAGASLTGRWIDGLISQAPKSEGKAVQFPRQSQQVITYKMNQTGRRYLRTTEPNYFGVFSIAEHHVKAFLGKRPVQRNRVVTMVPCWHPPTKRGAAHLGAAKIKARRLKE